MTYAKKGRVSQDHRAESQGHLRKGLEPGSLWTLRSRAISCPISFLNSSFFVHRYLSTKMGQLSLVLTEHSRKEHLAGPARLWSLLQTSQLSTLVTGQMVLRGNEESGVH